MAQKALTLEEAKKLTKGQTLHDLTRNNADKTPKRWKVTSVKTWKTRPNDIRIGLKHGLYEYDYAEACDLKYLTLP